MNKFRVAIDVDGVLNDLMEKTIDLYNMRHDTTFTVDDFKEYDIYKDLDFEDANDFVNLWAEKELWDSLEPRDDAQRCVQQLVNAGYEIYFATSTDAINYEWKVRWLENYFPMIPENNIMCIHNKNLLNVDVLIDDCPKHLTSNSLYYRVCFDFPWNRAIHDEVYGIYRAHNWEEVVNAVNEIYEFDNARG